MNIQSINNNRQNNISYKGKFNDKLTDWTAKVYGKHIANSEKLRNVCENLAKKNVGDVSTHLQVLGSAITSTAYMTSTMKNKNFDKDNARTLAVNQGLCFVVPTIGAYVTDHYVADIKKNMEYNYAAKLEKTLINATPEQKAKILANKGKKLKGVRTLLGILTFTMLYRYVTPVAVTPFANKIGNWLNNKKKEETQPTAMEIKLEPAADKNTAVEVKMSADKKATQAA